MNLFDYLLPFALALGLLILVHELGHYLVARWCGVKVLRFSIGFGKPLIVKRAGRDQTEWALAAFPLGGYVKMLDEREGPVAPAELHRSFNRQNVYRRFAIVAAGPIANFLLAIVLYWGLFVAGSDELRPRLALSETPAIAQAAGVREGDLVVSIDDEAVRSWQDLRWMLLQHALDKRELVLKVRALEDVEAFRRLDLTGVAIDEAKTDLVARIGLKPGGRIFRPSSARSRKMALRHAPGCRRATRCLRSTGWKSTPGAISCWQCARRPVAACRSKCSVARRSSAFR